MARGKASGPSLKSLLKDWSLKVRQRDGLKCCVCQSQRYVQAHHILQKEVYPDFKLELQNGLSLCVRHHKFGRFSAHRNALWFVGWLRENKPEQFEWASQRVGKEELNEQRTEQPKES